MIVTEDEAKTKRCQEGFGPPVVPTATEARGSPSRCIASQCMAWRWFDNTSDQAITQPRGYCGKAGRL